MRVQLHNHSDFINFILKTYPWSQQALKTCPPSEELFSNFTLSLSKRDFSTIETFVSEFHKFTHSPQISQDLLKNAPQVAKTSPGNSALFTSFDFHISPEGPKLIEVNTNASQACWASLLYEFRTGNKLHFFEELKNAILSEANNFGLKDTPSILIVDEQPEKQRAYAEFVFYQALFESWGIKTEIADIEELQTSDKGMYSGSKPNFKFNFIYNRSTDFYFEAPQSSQLKKAYEQKLACVTPNPYEYGLIADKENLISFSNELHLRTLGAAIKNTSVKSETEKGATDKSASDKNVTDKLIKLFTSVIPKTGLISELPSQLPRAELQQYFFKPRRGYGGRGVYGGHKISQKTYEGIHLQPFLYQMRVPPPTFEWKDAKGAEINFKWDLRVLTYKDKIQLLWARTYTGQITNNQTLGGGIAPVILE